MASELLRRLSVGAPEASYCRVLMGLIGFLGLLCPLGVQGSGGFAGVRVT